jgi:hypothetical protein
VLKPATGQLRKLHNPVVITMIAVRMVQSSIHEIVDMVAVGHGFMPATWPMLVSAAVIGRALSRVPVADRQGVLVHVIPVNVVQMSVMQIIDMPVMPNSCVPAVGSVVVRMIRVMFLSAGIHGVAPSLKVRPLAEQNRT